MIKWTTLSVTVVYIVSVMTTHVICLDCRPEVNGSMFTVNVGEAFVTDCVIRHCDYRLITTEWWTKERTVYGMDYTKRIHETHFGNKSRLVISPVRIADTGMFTCVNSLDRSINVSIQLVVKDEPAGMMTSMETSPSSITTPSTASHYKWTKGILYMLIMHLLSKMC